MAYTTINKAASFHSDNIWDGTGSSQTISCGFQPDMTWIKTTSNTSNHQLHNSVAAYSYYYSSQIKFINI